MTGACEVCDAPIAWERQYCDSCRSRVKFLFIRTWRESHMVKVFGFVPIKEVKETIEREDGYPQDQQRLVFAGQQLDDDRTLNSYGVKSGDHLDLMLPRGSGTSANFSNKT